LWLYPEQDVKLLPIWVDNNINQVKGKVPNEPHSGGVAMAKKAIVPTHSLWSLISDDSRRALVGLHKANAELEKAKRAQFKANEIITPLQKTADAAFFG
jgi:hypothetical protein